MAWSAGKLIITILILSDIPRLKGIGQWNLANW